MATLDEQTKLKREQVEALRAQIAALEAGAASDFDESRRLGEEVVAKQAAIERVRANEATALGHRTDVYKNPFGHGGDERVGGNRGTT